MFKKLQRELNKKTLREEIEIKVQQNKKELEQEAIFESTLDDVLEIEELLKMAQ